MPNTLPLWAKLAFTAFMLVLVPTYWRNYGPTNFFYFCDVALFFTLAAFWLESPLLASAPAVGILLPQALWMADFIATLLGGRITGMTAYMVDDKLSLYARGLSLFHFWLPLVLVWLVWKLGYDPRAFKLWTVLAWVLVVVCYFFLPAPPAPADHPNLPVNVNYVYGLSDERPQPWLHPHLWFALVFIALPVVIYWPTHRLLLWLAPALRSPSPA